MKKTLAATVLAAFVFSSCHYVMRERIRGNGNIRTESRNASSFSGIDVSGDIDVYFTQDSVTSVKVEADEDLMPYIQTLVDDKTLEIGPRDGYNLKPTSQIKVFVSAPSVSYFEASGACAIIGQNKIVNSNSVTIDLSGASSARLDLQAPKVDADLSGAGSISLSGQTKDFNVGGSGSSDIKCFGLMTENTDVEISGAGDAEVFASVNLDVHVSGAGTVRYKGNPAIRQDISGAGSVRKAE